MLNSVVASLCPRNAIHVAIMAATVAISPRARASYLALYRIARRHLSSLGSDRPSSRFHRSDFANQPFTGSYDPGEPTTGPLADAAVLGAGIVTPRNLKQHLDQFVVGQERAKKIMSVSVYNHYLRISELQRKEEEEQQRLQQRLRREKAQPHPVEDEFPGNSETIHLHPPTKSIGPAFPTDTNSLDLEKTNVLLLGPSGVGKTLMARTLAKVLQVPFSMSDCTPFTQAGYIGEDAQVCVERLLAAANYDVAAAENGIICLDEVDKIAVSRTATGKDVGGEGVQQALLKIIEGTTLYIQAKNEKQPQTRSTGSPEPSNTATTGSPIYGGRYAPTSSTGSGGSASPSAKSETYTVRTDNILFIFTGAFTSLNKIILDRISKGSIGFGSPIRSASHPESGSSETLLSLKPGSEERKFFEKHLPFFTQSRPDDDAKFNPLDLVEPGDLQKFGLIPEFTGRIPVTVSLSALDEGALMRVLTEPRNSLVKQYEQIFQLSGIELRFTTGALREIAKSALGMGTGARGLRTCIERLLSEAMFEAPGSGIKHVLITEAVAQKKEPPIYLARGQQHRFQDMIEAEEEAWRQRHGQAASRAELESKTFEEYREKSKAAGVM